MRTRFFGLLAAALLAALGAMGPAAQAATPVIDGPTCVQGGGTVEYDSASGLWICVKGHYDGESIT